MRLKKCLSSRRAWSVLLTSTRGDGPHRGQLPVSPETPWYASGELVAAHVHTGQAGALHHQAQHLRKLSREAVVVDPEIIQFPHVRQGFLRNFPAQLILAQIEASQPPQTTQFGRNSSTSWLSFNRRVCNAPNSPISLGISPPNWLLLRFSETRPSLPIPGVTLRSACCC